MSLSVLARKTRAKQNATIKNSKCGFSSRGNIKKQGYCNNTGCCNKSNNDISIDKCSVNYHMSQHVSYYNYLRRKVAGNDSVGSGKCCSRDKCDEIYLGCDKIKCECLKGCKNSTNLKSGNILRSSDTTYMKKKRALYINDSCGNRVGYNKCTDNVCVDNKCVPNWKVTKNTCIQYKCVGKCNSKPRISYIHAGNRQCDYTKRVSVAGTASVGLNNHIKNRT